MSTRTVLIPDRAYQHADSDPGFIRVAGWADATTRGTKHVTRVVTVDPVGLNVLIDYFDRQVGRVRHGNVKAAVVLTAWRLRVARDGKDLPG